MTTANVEQHTPAHYQQDVADALQHPKTKPLVSQIKKYRRRRAARALGSLLGAWGLLLGLSSALMFGSMAIFKLLDPFYGEYIGIFFAVFLITPLTVCFLEEGVLFNFYGSRDFDLENIFFQEFTTIIESVSRTWLPTTDEDWKNYDHRILFGETEYRYSHLYDMVHNILRIP